MSLALDGLEHQRHKRAAERALLDNAIRFRDAAGAAGEYVWEVDLDGHFTYLSEGIEHISGYRPEELVGRTPIDLMPEQDRSRVRSWVGRERRARRFVSRLRAPARRPGTGRCAGCA